MFDWPPGVQQKTKVKIAQILWTLWLDFDGEITDSDDAVKELLEAMRGHNVDIPESDVMGYRIILPHLDGGKYGHYVRRLVLGQRTKEIRLVSDLPGESYLPDGAGGISVDDQIDRQLFGGIEPARGPSRDQDRSPQARDKAELHIPEQEPTRDMEAPAVPEPARGTARDMELPDTRDEVEVDEPARGPTRDGVMGQTLEPARGPARDVAGEQLPARGPTRDLSYRFDDEDDDPNDLDTRIRRLDAELVDLSGPIVLDEPTDTRPQDLVDTIVSLMSELESTLTATVVQVAPEGRTEADWGELLEAKSMLTERLASVLRRAKGAEARIVEVVKEKDSKIAGLEARLAAAEQQNVRLSGNIEALMRGERASGQHVRGAQRFLSEVPSDRPEGGRNPGGRRRTTGSDSTLAYSVGPP
jgi:hypothetical protein